MTDRELIQMALKFCDDIGELGGPYPYVNGTGIVYDSRQVAKALRNRLSQPDGPVMYLDQKTMTLSKPLKHEWVGLTDDEIYEYADRFLYQHGSNYGIKSFGKAIEAKLKEKNT